MGYSRASNEKCEYGANRAEIYKMYQLKKGAHDDHGKIIGDIEKRVFAPYINQFMLKASKLR